MSVIHIGRVSPCLAVMLIVCPLLSAQVLPQPRMGDPVHGLTANQLARFAAGRSLFETPLTAAAGLGPIFNQSSCGACHSGPATGGAGTISVIRFGMQPPGAAPFDPLTALGGSLLQAQAISDPCREVVPPQANVFATRITTPIFGAGLVEGILDADLLALEAGGGSGGLAHLVASLEDPMGPPRVGRFGWKSQVATLRSFSADAALNEMGLTSTLLPGENAPNGNAVLLAQCDQVADPEALPDGQGFNLIDRVTDFQRFLAPPPQTPRSGLPGEAVFVAIGCGACHVALTFTTGPAAEAALSGVALRPYSDFLLHDMGGLGDGIVQGGAPGSWMRTAPLWGVRSRDPLLHDGSVAGGTFAQRISQAIAAHAGEAAAAASAFGSLAPTMRQQVVTFLGSLGRREFDHNDDLRVDPADFPAFLACFLDGGPYAPTDACAVADLDQDGDVDLTDFAGFLQAYEGPFLDCDANQALDLVQIVHGLATDCDGDLVLDSCEVQQGAPDQNGNGIPDGCEPPTRHVIWSAEGAGGANASCADLAAALLALGQVAFMTANHADAISEFVSIAPGGILWVLLGTYPANHPLTASEGQALAALAAQGRSIYLEGTDVWGYDPQTAFAAVDGIENTTIEDGDDSLNVLDGAAFDALDLNDLTGIPYAHDTTANEWTDRIRPTGSTAGAPVDLGGSHAGTVWRNAPGAGETAYPVATCYLPADPYGRVLCQSWELGGFMGDLGVLVALYSQILDPVGPPPAPVFRRADCNGDGILNIADPIFLVQFLFGGSLRPACHDACDTNDDGVLNIADVVFGLSVLFSGASLPAPGGTCGPDGSPDLLGCGSVSCP